MVQFKKYLHEKLDNPRTELQPDGDIYVKSHEEFGDLIGYTQTPPERRCYNCRFLNIKEEACENRDNIRKIHIKMAKNGSSIDHVPKISIKVSMNGNCPEWERE